MAEPQTHKKIENAVRLFEESLRDLLASEAQESVDGAVRRLSRSTGPFRISGVEVDVVIRNLKLEAVGDHDRGGPETRRRKRPAARKRKPKAPAGRSSRGRPPGPVRSALLETFAGSDGEMSVADLRAALRDRKVKSTDENLHQQLRRLAQAGEIERAGRGQYRRRGS